MCCRRVGHPGAGPCCLGRGDRRRPGTPRPGTVAVGCRRRRRRSASGCRGRVRGRRCGWGHGVSSGIGVGTESVVRVRVRDNLLLPTVPLVWRTHSVMPRRCSSTRRSSCCAFVQPRRRSLGAEKFPLTRWDAGQSPGEVGSTPGRTAVWTHPTGSSRRGTAAAPGDAPAAFQGMVANNAQRNVVLGSFATRFASCHAEMDAGGRPVRPCASPSITAPTTPTSHAARAARNPPQSFPSARSP